MRINEPFFRFSAQAGKFAPLFAASATWLLGFATWQIMFLAYRMLSIPALPRGLPGPDAFVSVLAGDGVALPVINGLIVLFYYYGQIIGHNSDMGQLANDVEIGDRWQGTIACVIALIAGIGIYKSWFAAGKVDWTIPKPGELNMAGVYHCIFLTVEIYFLINFILSTIRIYLWISRSLYARELSQEVRHSLARQTLSLTRVFGAIQVAAIVFSISLGLDTGQGLIPLSTYAGTLILSATVLIVTMIGLVVGPYRKVLRVLLTDPLSVTLFLFATAGITLQLSHIWHSIGAMP